MNSKSLSVVLPKGRLFEPALFFLRELGIQVKKPENRELTTKNGRYKMVLAKARDVPVYVEHGVDLGITGLDVVEERSCSVFIPTQLPFGKCRLSVAVPEEEKVEVGNMDGFTIATEYPNVTTRYFAQKDVEVDVIELNGSIEVTPKIGIADAIVDIVDTGTTIRANELIEVETIMNVSALLLVNRISQKVKFEEINEITAKISTIKRKKEGEKEWN